MVLKMRSLFIIFFLCTSAMFAQQDKLITNFMYDKMSINPGETGLDDGICATSIYRNQWDKVNGAPNSAVLNVAANMNRFFPGGLGISFYHDAIGFSRQNNILLNYSYPISLGNVGTLGAGIGVGMMTYAMNP
ncbi:MAG: type IX secretion system membrane protein PorP/SprF, partial [Flavobacteriia bacterium]|nr:type IX secretion system membrane protein PorP/SprF [Flavobacteriia bacterium]